VHHRDLRVGRDDRRDVEEVAREDDEVELRRDRRDPVELPELVVEVGDREDADAGG
jgi:hypothetical protein